MAKRRVTERIVVVVGVVAIIGGGVTYYATRSKTSAYQTALVTKGAVVQSVTLSGVVVPTNSYSVAPPTSGLVTSVHVSVGQSVQTGAVLATISPSTNFADQIAAAQASLAQAEATLALAESETTTTTTTAPVVVSQSALLIAQITQSVAQLKTVCATPSCQSQLVSIQALLQKLETTSSKASNSASSGVRNSAPPPPSSAELAADQSIVVADQSALNNVEASVPSNVMTSPVAGVVAALSLSVGQNVNPTVAADSIIIISPNSWQAQVNVPASQLVAIHTGQSATVTPAGQTSRTGTVSSIGNTATTDATTGNVTFPVSIAINGSAQDLFDGSTAGITIDTSRVSNVVVVPTSALIQNGSQTQVELLLQKGITETRSVRIGAVGIYGTQILSGLNPGQKVVLANLSTPLPTPTVQLGALRRAFAGGGGGGRGGGGRGGGGRAGG